MAKRTVNGTGASQPLYFLPLGGAGEIGMNLNLYALGDDWLMIDLGVSFGDDSAPGVDVVMPDPSFIADRRDRLHGLVLTHAHEDHLGAVQWLWPKLRCPVYCTPFTASILRRKLAETGLAGQVDITIVPLGSRFTVGPFDLELVTITHSTLEPNCVAIRTPQGTVLHTGDWKFDPDPLVGAGTDEAKLRAIGDEGVLAMVCDSTNAMREGEAGSEADVRDSLMELVGDLDGRVAVACFASNLARLHTIAEVALAHDRHPALIGRSLRRMDEAARENGYLTDLPPFLSERDAGFLPRDNVLLICTGSQGEPRAALARIVADSHPHIVLEEGDSVIFSSRVIPGNEKAIARVQNGLARMGVRVITERDHFVHVSGHPARDELTRLYQMIRPQIAIPVHGELRHMQAHAELARACQVKDAIVVENGDMVKLGPGRAEIVDTVPTGRWAVDGDRVIPLGSHILRDRARLAQNGSAVVTLVLDGGGRLRGEPLISLQGLIDSDHEDDMRLEGVDAVRRAIEGLSKSARGDDATVIEAARIALRRAMKDLVAKKPATDVHLVRI